jgi:N-acetyl-alpha-D-muramate 1-phosphate uridylyltransferase
MARIRHAVILAAGRGQRLMPLTADRPKPMVRYLDSTLIAHSISKIRRHIEYLHVTVGYRGAMLAHHLIELGVSSVFNTEGKTNSWWIHNTVLANLNEPIFVLTCDNVTSLDFGLLESDYYNRHEPACMLVPVIPVPGLEGDYISHQNNIVTSISRTRPAAIYCSGIQVLNPLKVRSMTRDEGDFYSIWAQLIDQKQLMVSSVYPSDWFSVDTIADLDQVEVANRARPLSK